MEKEEGLQGKVNNNSDESFLYDLFETLIPITGDKKIHYTFSMLREKSRHVAENPKSLGDSLTYLDIPILWGVEAGFYVAKYAGYSMAIYGITREISKLF